MAALGSVSCFLMCVAVDGVDSSDVDLAVVEGSLLFEALYVKDSSGAEAAESLSMLPLYELDEAYSDTQDPTESDSEDD